MASSSLYSWLHNARQSAFASTQNKIITSVATTALFVTCTVAFIKIMGAYQHRAKKNFEAHKRTKYINQLPKGDNLEAPEPGTITMKDFRRKQPNSSSAVTDRRHIRVITWNIERGYKTHEIIEELKRIDADIILLQEVDIGTQRTDMLDVGNEIANALGYQIVYGADCWHINDYHENDANASREVVWNARPHSGCEGNAILSRLDVVAAYPVVMPCVRNSYRPSHDHMKRHTAVVAIIDSGDAKLGELACYSLHMDAYSGRVHRATVQYKAVYQDIVRRHSCSPSSKEEQKQEEKADEDGIVKKRRTVIVGGDFNTHNHGVVRLLDSMSGDDALRYKFWGWSEAEWWDRFVIGKEIHLVDDLKPAARIRLKDPFDKSVDVTAWKIIGGITVWSGKIDWLLYDYDKLSVVHKCVSNTDASDHQYLLCDFKPKSS